MVLQVWITSVPFYVILKFLLRSCCKYLCFVVQEILYPIFLMIHENACLLYMIKKWMFSLQTILNL